MSTSPEKAIDPTLGQLFDPSLALEARLALLAQARREQAELAPRIDRALLQRERQQSDAISRLGALNEELRLTADKLAGAPVHEAVFVAPCELPDGRTLARVARGAGDVLLESMDDGLLDALRRGDRVLLASAGNVVLGRAGTAPPGAGECAVVERWLDAGRVLLRHRDQTVVARTAAALAPENLKEGESVRIDPLSGFALERVAPAQGSRHAPDADATGIEPEALAGYDEIRDTALRRATYPLLHPALAGLYGLRERRASLLLGGPPGVGKTLLARVMAGVLRNRTGRECRVYTVQGANLLSPWVGETEQRITALMREIREADGWSILFIDEVEAIARARGAAGNVHADKFLSTWLSELEGFQGRAPCLLVAATNRIDMLDAAFRSRFATEIEFPRPRMEAARAIFARHLPQALPYEADGEGAAAARARLIDAAVGRLYLPNAPGALLATLRLRDGKARGVYARDLMSGRLIEQICGEAIERAFQRHAEGGAPGLCIDDVDAAVDGARDRLRATLTPANAHAHLSDLPQDIGVVAVERAPRVRAGTAFLHRAA